MAMYPSSVRWTGSLQTPSPISFTIVQGLVTLMFRMPCLKQKSLIYFLHSDTAISWSFLYPSSFILDTWSGLLQQLVSRYLGRGVSRIALLPSATSRRGLAVQKIEY